MRQDLLDQIVWAEVIRLLEDPALIQQELDRRLAAARSSDPTKQREQSLRKELTRVGKSLERLLTAYLEELLSLEQLRERMPALRQREQTLRAELQAITDQANDRATFLRLAESLGAFLDRLRSTADTLDVLEPQRIVRLVVKEVLIGDDNIIIRHSIPIAPTPPATGGPPPPSRSDRAPTGQSYLLRSWSERTALRSSFIDGLDQSVHHHSGVEERADQSEHPLVGNPFRQMCHQPVVIDPVKRTLDTLPTVTSTVSPSGCGLSVPNTRWRAKP